MNFLNRKPREIGRLRTDYSPPEVKAVDAMIERMKATDQEPDGPLDSRWVRTHQDDPFVEPFEWKGDKVPFLERLSKDPQISHLDEIKVHLRQLTWAEMQEYCAGTNSDPKTVHEWSNK